MLGADPHHHTHEWRKGQRKPHEGLHVDDVDDLKGNLEFLSGDGLVTHGLSNLVQEDFGKVPNLVCAKSDDHQIEQVHGHLVGRARKLHNSTQTPTGISTET